MAGKSSRSNYAVYGVEYPDTVDVRRPAFLISHSVIGPSTPLYSGFMFSLFVSSLLLSFSTPTRPCSPIGLCLSFEACLSGSSLHKGQSYQVCQQYSPLLIGHIG